MTTTDLTNFERFENKKGFGFDGANEIDKVIKSDEE